VADLATFNGAVHVLCSHVSVGLLAFVNGDFSKAVAAMYLAQTDRFAAYIMKQMEMAEWPHTYSKNIFVIGDTKLQYIYNHKLTAKGE
jgi:hypothetical protein